MEPLSYSNKLKSLDHDTKIKFNSAIHGQQKDSVISYRHASYGLKVLIRRRLKDDDGSVEIINLKKTIEKPIKAASKKTKGEN